MARASAVPGNAGPRYPDMLRSMRASGNPAGQYNVGDTITAHVTYSHAFVFPLISSILGNTIDLSSNATFRLEGQPTAYC